MAYTRDSLVCAGLSPQQTQKRSLSLKGNSLGRSPSYSNKILTVSDGCFDLICPLPGCLPEYIPYVFQVLGQMLELHASSVPNEYRSILPFLLTPAAWQQKGSVPGLVKLLKAFLTRDSAQLVETAQYTAVLAVVQQRLIPSKINDGWGFELLQAVVQNIPPYVD